MRKNVVRGYKMFDAASLTPSTTSNEVNVINLDKASIYVDWTGSSGTSSVFDNLTGYGLGPNIQVPDFGYAIKITPSTTYSLTMARIATQVNAGSGSYVIRVFADDAGGSVPGTILATSQTYSPSAPTPLQTTDFTFPSPITLNSGTPYWVGIFSTVNTGSLGVGVLPGSPYSSAEYFTSSWMVSPSKLAIQLFQGVIMQGTLAVQAKNAETGTWFDLDFGSPIVISGASGDHLLILNELPHNTIRLQCDVTSGSGSINAVLVAKQVGG